ncbi:ankyrin repeat-containing domain protein [Podospora fimiseda]|uniref:Ankyrin repeat-containing domain protein n=1 Tax=Podospora fimiseda TaxID=252190 RepID=A0AAN7BJ72_9PEZI|nr:ankyrin repeat-containing domain protein [Podospora fimiseda]
MAPQLLEDEIDDLIYFARAGEKDELISILGAISKRIAAATPSSTAEILAAAVDESNKSTCLHMAAANGHTDVVKFLLEQFSSRPKEEKQAFLDAPNEYGNTGLHWAAMNGHLPVVKLLVEAGSSVALPNDKNYIPLDLASFGEKINVVDYFLKEVRELEAKEAAESLASGVNDADLQDDEEEKESKTQN